MDCLIFLFSILKKVWNFLDLKSIISVFSLLLSFAAVCISWYSASKDIRKQKKIDNQKFDLVVRPRGRWREVAPAELMMGIQQINFMPELKDKNTINKKWECETLYFVDDDIGDKGVYCGIVAKSGLDPFTIKREIQQTQYFDKIYITKQGKKKHNRYIKNKKRIKKGLRAEDK